VLWIEEYGVHRSDIENAKVIVAEAGEDSMTDRNCPTA
jgi:hypothetical protein